MGKIDLIFYAIGIFCYFTTMLQLRDQDGKSAEFTDSYKKRALFANRIVEQKRKEATDKATHERKMKNRPDLKKMSDTMEQLGDIADKEVMRQSRITNGL